jgi:hypothetical protein
MLKRIFNAVAIVVVAAASVVSYADGSGFYAGAMIGPTATGGSSSSGSSSKNSWGGRGFLGYSTNPYFSYEGGLAVYPQSTISTGCTSSNQRKLYFDLLLKGSMPISGGTGVYAKAGAATSVYVPGLNSCKSSGSGNLYPAVSIGGSASVTNSTALDVSWNRYIYGGSVKNIDLYAIGFIYSFSA